MKLTDPNSKKRFPFILKPVEEKIEIHRLREESCIQRKRKKEKEREGKPGIKKIISKLI